MIFGLADAFENVTASEEKQLNGEGVAVKEADTVWWKIMLRVTV
jgi:hypothetical protein